MRLHANLLFYGLDEGTWSNPPTGSNSGFCWSGAPWPDAENREAHWGSSNIEQPLGTPSTAVSSLNQFGNDQSTDEGSEAKGSESDSLPDSNEACEGLLVSPSQQQFPSAAPPTHPYMSANAQAQASLCSTSAAASLVPQNMQVPTQKPVLTEATPIYSSYLSTGSFLATHGYGAGEVATPYAYDIGPTLNTSFISGVASSVMGTAGVSTAADAQADGVPSIGSYAHLSGQCSRCCFHPKGRCANGFSCEFCHFDHEKRPRNGKKKRYRRQSDGGSDDGLSFNVAEE